MKKGLLVYRINRDDPANIGVVKKCKAQKKAFEENGLEVDMLWLSEAGVLKNEKLIEPRNIPPHSLKIYQFYFFRFGKIIQTIAEAGSYNFIYLRHPFFDPLLVGSLRQIKKTIPQIKIFLEINTYPYDAEPKRLLHRLSLKLDQYYRRSAKEYIDRIIDYGERETIWNIPTISMRNGIDVAAIPLSNSQVEEGNLRLIAVGNWSYWHGLDRILEGLKIFYQEGGKGISLKIVGAGDAVEDAIDFIRKNKLERYVECLGTKSGKALDAIFETADVGVGTLGLHRKSVALNSSLKHRSYCARGIPFILSGDDPDFSKDLAFVNYFDATDQAISMQELKGFFEKLIRMRAGYKEEMRDYAEKVLSWRKKLSGLVEQL